MNPDARHHRRSPSPPAPACLVAVLAALVTPGPTLRAQERGGLDVVFTEAGQAVPGRILYLDDDGGRLRMRVVLEGPRGGGTALRDVPLGRVRAIDFAPIPGESAALEDPSAPSIDALRDLWNELRRHLARPRSNAGRVGLAYARRLVDEASRHWLDEALEVFEALAAHAWRPGVRAEARAGALRVKLALGHHAEAEAEAGLLAAETDDATLLIEARHVLALAGRRRLGELVEEHPRWREDDEVRPECLRLFHETVDRFLHAPLFHGSRGDVAARGLWHAREACLFLGESGEAAALAEDLVALYPDSEFARRLADGK